MIKINDEICRRMIQAAKKVNKNAFPKTKHGYSCAVLTKKGNIYPGVSYTSDTYTLTVHGDAAALIHAAIHGEHEIIAITGPNCHICKQLIWENSLRSGIDILIITEKNAKIIKTPISKLMPEPWPTKPSL